ncbi:hypothetical protein GTQ55_03920 [Microbulbifer hydrolyticus]|uniref:Uncharacterized protein n=2 Tax=Microbulbifer hydrolyticus TaxID=48074 RepID=A0A6P1TC17_9GAMM|nr:hypothetical protein [Microbulbifer hydrolyticus]MBB5210965.1 hypothetical protein [Microbulbifer hydrolyticus]QHQ38222.1 hypothetical protein GTQ55_03920 [Microbulbifer hydrolyticus]
MPSNRLRSSFFFMLALYVVQACAGRPTVATEDIVPIAEAMKEVDVLLVSDHTLPHHLNLSSGGANGEERRFIDPTLQSLNSKLINRGLRTHILNVEDMVVDRDIQNKATFDAAYKKYDQILEAAVKHGVTIASIHYDADKILAENYGKNSAYASAEEEGEKYGYVGGIQLILDKRATSDATLALANRMVHRDKILQKLNTVGFRVRPGYGDKVRFQNNLTLNIAGHSQGGAFLLEIAPQDQAVRLYGSPEKIVEAIEAPMDALADTLYAFRQSLQ